MVSQKRYNGCLIQVAFFLLLTGLKAGGLTCVCDDCLDGMCTVPEGGKCYSQVFKVDGQESRRRRCYESSYLHFCDTVNSMVVIECCATDYCNGLLYPTLPEITTTPTETPPLTETPPPSETPDELSCYAYNSLKTETVSRCSTSTGSCYQLTRRSPLDGNVTQVRQGCSENCVPEERNRVTRTCCNSSLCNAFPWQHSEIPAPLETNTVGTMIINPSYTRTIELNTNSEAVPFSSSSSSRTSATSLISSTSFHQLNPSSSTFDSSSNSGSTIYIISSAILGFLYIIVLIGLCVLIGVVCHRQNKIIKISNAQKQKKSVETLNSESL